MGLAEIKKRIERAEQQAYTAGEYRHIIQRIADGAYYDELTDEEKDAYCAYHDTARDVWEQVTGLINEGNLHVITEMKRPPATAAEIAETVKEIEEYIRSLPEPEEDESEDIT